MKQKLLQTNYFIDNEYLDKYLILCQKGSDIKTFENSESHHILPFSYFVEKLNIKTKADKIQLRRKSIKIGTKEYDLITKDNILFLSYYEHCLAHYYLYKCTIGKLKIANEFAFNKMISRNLILKNCSDNDIQQLLTYIKELREDPESQSYKNQLINKVIIENYSIGGYKLCLKVLKEQYNINSKKTLIKARATKLNVLAANFTEAWTDDELKILKEIYPKEGYLGCKKYLPARTKFAIQARATYLNLTAPGPSKKNAKWTFQELEILDNLYPIGGWKLVHSKLPNRSEKAIKHQTNKRKIYLKMKEN